MTDSNSQLSKISTALQKRKDTPPYWRYAFWNPYNLSLLGGAAAAAAATGDWWLMLGAMAGEALWMLFAPDSRVLRRVWFDKVWEGEQAAARKRRQAEKFGKLPDADKARALALRELQERIQQMATDNPTFSVELLHRELHKLEDLVDDFLDLATLCARYDEYLQAFGLEELESDLRRYQLQNDKLPPGDQRRTVAQKNLAVLLQRKDRYKELRRDLQTARGQMDLMENTFRLLADEVVSMRSPNELGARLEEMRDGVEAVRQTMRETERVFQAMEQR